MKLSSPEDTRTTAEVEAEAALSRTSTLVRFPRVRGGRARAQCGARISRSVSPQPS